MRKLEQKEWWPELVAKKDSYSLRELSEMFGATPGAINNALKRNGISRKAAPSGPRAARKTTAPAKKAAPKAKAGPKKTTPKKTTPKKAAPKKAAAKTRAKPGPKPGPRRSTLAKLEPFKDQLGQVADSEIASLAGVSAVTVAKYRKSLGVAALRKRGPAKKAAPKAAPKVAKARKKPGRKSKIAPFEHLLGKETDSSVAKKAGVSTNAVTNYRNRKGIAPSRKRKAPVAKAAPAKKAPAPKAPKAKKAKATKAKALLAFRVKLKGQDGIVLASSLVEAAEKAVKSGKKVSGIELLGPVLD